MSFCLDECGASAHREPAHREPAHRKPAHREPAAISAKAGYICGRGAGETSNKPDYGICTQVPIGTLVVKVCKLDPVQV